MNCKNCGKEIDNDSKFCNGCGAENTVSEAPAATAGNNEASPPPVVQSVTETKKQKLKFKDLPPKEKKKRAIIGGICLVLAFIIIFGDVFGTGGGKNDFVVETGNDDIYGGVAFNLSLGEFIDKYNALLEEDEEYKSVADMQKLSYFDFKNDGVKDGIHNYIYSFGYITGTYPFTVTHDLASLLIGVNPETEKIQAVKYVWQADGYNTDGALLNYYYEIPAKIFSIFYSEIDYPYGGDYSDYEDLLNSLIDSNEPYEFTGNTMYGLFDTGSSNVFGIQFIALSEDSELYASAK